MTVSPEGIVTGVARYLPYGQPRVLEGSESLPTDKTFTGQRAEAFGLMDYNARFYDLSIMMFISPDTLVQDQYNPHNWNRYAYTSNNPVNRVDPSGHSEDCTNGDYQCQAELKREKQVGDYRYDYEQRLKAHYPNSPDWLLTGEGDSTGFGQTLGSFVRLGFMINEVASGNPNAWNDFKNNWGDHLQAMTLVAPGLDDSLNPYEVGSFKDLQMRSKAGDGLDIHHAPPKQPAGQILPDYND